jgi:hypothetical protein
MKIRYLIETLVLTLGLFAVLNFTAVADAKDSQAALEQRANQYWTARQSGDIRSVYELESASLPGGWLTPEKAMMVGGLPIRKVKVEEIAVDGEHGKVRVSAEVLVGTLGWVPQTLEDKWVLIEGQWYHETYRP